MNKLLKCTKMIEDESFRVPYDRSHDSSVKSALITHAEIGEKGEATPARYIKRF